MRVAIVLLLLSALVYCAYSDNPSECSNALKGKIHDNAELDRVVQNARTVYVQ